MRNVHADHPTISWEELERTRKLMDQALPHACVRDYRGLIKELSLLDPDDRHVLAAAIRVDADVIVSFNTRDFPPSRLEPWPYRHVSRSVRLYADGPSA